MSEKMRAGQSGGVNILGAVGSIGGDVVGRDKIACFHSTSQLDGALRPIVDAIRAAPTGTQAAAELKMSAMKQEASKGKFANDRLIARLIDGLVDLVPGATSAVVSAFATPILAGIAGPVTGFVLDKLRGR
jgi:hypothetical protein